MPRPARPVLTSDRVRYVGDPMAIVVAESAVQAKDAAETVFLDIESLPTVTRASEAAASGAPQLHDEVPGNVAAEFHYGNADKVAAAFAAATHVTRLEIPSNRIVVCPMEPRSAQAECDAESCFCCFCGKLSAVDISFSAEILGRRPFGECKNSGGVRCSCAVFRCFGWKKSKDRKRGITAGDRFIAPSDRLRISATISQQGVIVNLIIL